MLYISCFIGVMAFVGIILPIVINGKLRKLLRAAEHPAKSNHPLVKSMVNKFTACYKLKIGVNSVDNFVDKYVYSYKTGGLYLSTWDRLCGQPVRILGITAMAGLVYGYFIKGGQPAWLSTAWLCLGTAALLILYGSFFDRKELIRLFAYEMKDYLANSLQSKLEQEYVYPELLRESRQEAAAAAEGMSAGMMKKRQGSQPEEGKIAGDQPEKRKNVGNQPEEGKLVGDQPEDRRVASTHAQLSAGEKHPSREEQEIIDEILQEYLS